MTTIGTQAQAWLRWSVGLNIGYPSSFYYTPTYFVWPYFISTRVPYSYSSYYRPSVLYPMSYPKYTLGPIVALGEQKRLAWLQRQETQVVTQNQIQLPSRKKESPTQEFPTQDQIPSIRTPSEY